jgi:tetratricopeptide (TPR) repeat protein
MSTALKNQLVQRAADAFQRRAFGEAADICGQVLNQFGDEANALMMLGSMRMDAGDVAGAIDLYERGRAAMPTHIHVLVNLGAAYRAAGRLHEARIALEAALAVDRRFAVAHNNLGNVLLDLGDRAGAKREYERALVGQANYADPVAALAHLAEEEHRLDDAHRLSERALLLAPNNVSGRLTRARVTFRTGDANAAAGDLEALLRRSDLSPTNRVVAEGYLGEAYDRTGRVAEAFAAFSRANELQYGQHAQAFAQDRGPLALRTIVRLNAFVAAADVTAWPRDRRRCSWSAFRARGQHCSIKFWRPIRTCRPSRNATR